MINKALFNPIRIIVQKKCSWMFQMCHSRGPHGIFMGPTTKSSPSSPRVQKWSFHWEHAKFPWTQLKSK